MRNLKINGITAKTVYANGQKMKKVYVNNNLYYVAFDPNFYNRGVVGDDVEWEHSKYNEGYASFDANKITVSVQLRTNSWSYSLVYALVDFTEINTLTCTGMKAGTSSWMSDSMYTYCGVANNIGDPDNMTWLKKSRLNGPLQDNYTWSFDVSDITGEHYIVYGLRTYGASRDTWQSISMYTFIGKQ